MIDLIDRLEDLHKQATVERSHYYTGKCIRDAIEEIKMLRRDQAALADFVAIYRDVWGAEGKTDADFCAAFERTLLRHGL